MVNNNSNQHDLFIDRELNYKSDNIITSIDIGSDKIICFIAKIDKILDKEKPRIVGFGYSQSKGIRNGAITNISKLEESLMSSVFALNVAPKKQIFLFLILLFNMRLTLFSNSFDLWVLDLITLFITDKSILNLLAVETIALVSFGKQDPP